MPKNPINTGRILGRLQKDAEREIKAQFTGVADTVNAAVRRVSNNGRINPNDSRAIASLRRSAEDAVYGMFVDPATRLPFGADGVTARSPFAQTLNRSYARAVIVTVAAHHKYLQQHAPDEVYTWLRNANRTGTVAESVTDRTRAWIDALGLFMPNPLARYEPMHTWVDANGYRLSDRIWYTSDRTRRMLDQLLTELINQGRGAEYIERQVSRFLIPGRAQLRTRRPYGRDASFDAMRLARTEISHAAAQASFAAGLLNPYSVGMDWLLSPSHPKRDVCDDLATLGMGRERLKEPYPYDSARIPPAHPHCLCGAASAMADNPAQITAEIRLMLEDPGLMPDTPHLNPAAGPRFAAWLLGATLSAAFANEFEGVFAA